jgi:hypothetical protein
VFRFSELSTEALVERLRKAASIWFKNDDLLLLEELIRRLHKLGLEVSQLEERLDEAGERRRGEDS